MIISGFIAMIYQFLADAVLVIHMLFIVFVIGGGFLVLKKRWLAWVQIPAAIWGILIEWMGWFCPLTPLENHFRQLAGQSVYDGGFVEHYLLPVIYLDGLTREIQILLGIFVVAVNMGIYTYIILSKKKQNRIWQKD